MREASSWVEVLLSPPPPPTVSVTTVFCGAPANSLFWEMEGGREERDDERELGG